MADEIKVYFKHRSDLFTRPQADTVVVDRYKEFLKAQSIVLAATEAEATILHYFGTSAFQEELPPAKPFCISPLLDIDSATSEYADTVAKSLSTYVSEGQKDQNWKTPKNLENKEYTFNCNKTWFYAASMIFVQGNTELQQLEQTLGALPNTCVVPMGLPETNTQNGSEFTSLYNVKDYILCVARIEPRKNQLLLLKAFENSPLPIVLVDGGLNSNAEYEKSVKSFKRTGTTIITGKVNQSVIASAIQSARVHVLPSFYEIPGVVSLEAMRQGCPVVATRNGSASDYLGSNAFYCDPASPDSIYNATIAAYYAPRPLAKDTSTPWSKVTAIIAAQYRALADKNKLQSPAIQPARTQDEVEIQIERAEELATNNNLEQALAVVKELEQNFPADSRAQRALAAMHLVLGKTKEAKSRFALAYALNPKDSKILRGLALCARMEENLPAAYEWLVKASTVNAQDTEALLELLKISYTLKKFDDIETALSAYCATPDCDQNLQFSYAGVLFELKKFSEAKVVCNNLLARNPASKDAKALLSRIEDASAQPKHVAATVQTEQQPIATPSSTTTQKSGLAEAVAQSRYDATPNTESLLAQLEEYRRNLKLEELKKGLEQAQTLEKTLSRSQRQRLLLLTADYQVLNGNLEAAKAVYEEVSKDDPYSTRALCGLGALAANSGKWNEAQKYFSSAISLDPRQDVAYAGLGLCAKQENQLDRAWGFYKTALSINPENMRGLLGLLEIGYPMKRYAEIEQSLRAYLDLHPADTEFSYALAGCLFAQEHLDEASDTLNMILTFKPQDQRAQELATAIQSKRESQVVANTRSY